MRSLLRNKIKVYYANYLGKVEATDDDGNYTGEYISSYTDPKMLKINTSAASGDISTQLFTPTLNYDRVLLTDDTSLDVDENTVFWIEADPYTEPFNYVVKKKAKSLNVLGIAVSEVKVNA